MIISWHQPIVLLALAAAGWSLWLILRSDRRRAVALAAFGVSSAGNSPRSRAVRTASVALGLTLLVVALAGPRLGEETREVRQEGIDLMIVLDVSRSMLAEDVVPNRLERARAELEDLVARLPGSRVGIVLFAGEAFLQCPLTTDLGTVRRFLAAAHPDLMPAQGTDLGEAVRVSTAALGQQSEPGRRGEDRRARVILVVSDGEDHVGRIDQALSEAATEDVRVFAAGIGEAAGAHIPIYRDGRRVGVHTDRNGRAVTTRLDEHTLRRIAASGDYLRIGGAGSIADLATPLTRLGTATVSTSEYVSHVERFQWPLAVGLLLLTLERGLVARRRRPVTVQ